MMKRIRAGKIFLAAALVAVAIGVFSIAFAGSVKPTATLNGVVAADGLVQVGAAVSEGQVLVQVKTVVGLIPAARANAAGKVTAVYVAAGDHLTSGQAVAEITTAD